MGAKESMLMERRHPQRQSLNQDRQQGLQGQQQVRGGLQRSNSVPRRKVAVGAADCGCNKAYTPGGDPNMW